MKNLILFFALNFLVLNSNATVMEAKPLKDLIATIQQTDFKFIEIGKSFGFDTTQSCLHASPEMIVLKNYCFPKKEYPAKGYTIISLKFGIVELYQENLSDTIQKRDVDIQVFSGHLRELISGDISTFKIVDTNKIIEHFYKSQPGSCWSTNYSYYTGKPDVACTQRAVDVVGLQEWANETQAVSGDEVQWKELIYNLDQKFTN